LDAVAEREFGDYVVARFDHAWSIVDTGFAGVELSYVKVLAA
jgi:hypothetical protein